MHYKTKHEAQLMKSYHGVKCGSPHPYIDNFYYIKPESHHIFEPQEGDVVMMSGYLPAEYTRSFMVVEGTPDHEGQIDVEFARECGAVIILRNGKAFIMPESEQEVKSIILKQHQNKNIDEVINGK